MGLGLVVRLVFGCAYAIATGRDAVECSEQGVDARVNEGSHCKLIARPIEIGSEVIARVEILGVNECEERIKSVEILGMNECEERIIRARVCVCVCVCVQSETCARACAYVCVCVLVRVHVYASVCVYVCGEGGGTCVTDDVRVTAHMQCVRREAK